MELNFRCASFKCEKTAFYGHRYGERIYCEKHKLPGTHYFDQICLCGKGKPLFFNAEGEKMHCQFCKRFCEGVHDKECPFHNSPGEKYGFYCKHCFTIKFPIEVSIRTNKLKQLRVFEKLNSSFPDLYFISDTILESSGSVLKVDIRTTIKNVFLGIEVMETPIKNKAINDEYQRYESMIEYIKKEKNIKLIVIIQFNAKSRFFRYSIHSIFNKRLIHSGYYIAPPF